MRPGKPINPGAHKYGMAGRTQSGSTPGGKGRHFVDPVPDETPPEMEASATAGPDVPELYIPGRAAPISQGNLARADKYAGRASFSPFELLEAAVRNLGDAAAEWVDPPDAVEIGLSTVTIDRRPGLREDPPDTYFRRYSSKIPGHTRGRRAGS